MSKERTGKYFGTEIDEKWWKRYTKGNLLARGNGTLSYNDQSISFLRLLTRAPIVIDFAKILEFKVGKWHSGQWGAGAPIIKVLWKNEKQLLCSGFSVSQNPDETKNIVSELNAILESVKKN